MYIKRTLPKSINIILCLSQIILFGCKKSDPAQTDEDGKDDIINKPPSTFIVTVTKTSYNYAIIGWSASSDPENGNILYSIYLNDKKIADSIAFIYNYKFENLNPETQYTGYVKATDPKLNSTSESFTISTKKYYNRFSKIYGFDDLFLRGVSIAKNTDRGYVIAGFYNGWDLALVNIDTLGNEIWKKTYPYSHRSTVQIKKTNDNGYIIVGCKYVLKVSEDGNKEWDFVNNFSDNNSEYDAIIQTNDNGYLVVGTGYEDGLVNGDESTQAALTKLDPNGNLLWVKYYGKPQRTLGFYIEKTPDDNFILLGSTETSNMHIYINKVDNNGQSLWSKTIIGGLFTFPNQIKQTQDNGFIISTFTMNSINETRPRIVKIDADGNLIWDKYFLQETVSAKSNAICQTLDGGYAFIGLVELTVSTAKAACLLVKISSDGTLEWETRYKRANEAEDFWWVGYDIMQTNDKGFIIAAEKSWINFKPVDDLGFWVFKTDPMGEFND